jgi:hypothetical protein
MYMTIFTSLCSMVRILHQLVSSSFDSFSPISINTSFLSAHLSDSYTISSSSPKERSMVYPRMSSKTSRNFYLMSAGCPKTHPQTIYVFPLFRYLKKTARKLMLFSSRTLAAIYLSSPLSAGLQNHRKKSMYGSAAIRRKEQERMERPALRGS